MKQNKKNYQQTFLANFVFYLKLKIDCLLSSALSFLIWSNMQLLSSTFLCLRLYFLCFLHNALNPCLFLYRFICISLLKITLMIIVWIAPFFLNYRSHLVLNCYNCLLLFHSTTQQSSTIAFLLTSNWTKKVLNLIQMRL